MFTFSGKQPANLGAKNGKLAPVIHKPNNVSSQADINDRAHYVAPFKFTGDAAAAFQQLAGLVQTQPRARVITQDGQYLHAEFSSPLMGFVDDVEFLLEFLANVKLGDAARTAELRQRHLAVVIDGLHSGQRTPLPGQPPTWLEQTARWIAHRPAGTGQVRAER